MKKWISLLTSCLLVLSDFRIPVKAEGISTGQTNSEVNFSLALGRAVEYGIVADTYEQKNHQQTNFAVKTYMNTGQINGEPDLSGTHDVPYQIGEIKANKLRFGTSTYQGQAVQYDVYLPKSYESNINNYIQIDGGGKNTVNLIYESENTIKNNVQSMLDSAVGKSNTLASRATTLDLTNNLVNDINQYVVDTTGYDDNAVIYINIPDTSDYSKIRQVIANQSAFHLHKKENQVIVVNMLGSSPVNLMKYIVTLPEEDRTSKDDRYSTFSPSGQNSSVNVRIDKQIAQKVIWNFPDATNITMNTSAGAFIAPKANINVTGTSAGWIVSGGKVTTDGCEFHYIYTDRKYTPQGPASRNLRFTVYKGMKDNAEKTIGLNGRKFDFELYEADASFNPKGSPIQTVQNNDLANIDFSVINYTESQIEENNGDFYYVIKEKNPGTITDGVKNWDGEIDIHLRGTVADNNGEKSINFVMEYYRYQSAADKAAGKTDNTVRQIDVAGEEFTFSTVYNHYIPETEITITAKKNMNDEPSTDPFNFTLTEVADADGTPLNEAYTDSATNDASGNISFNKITYTASDAGKHYYKISEIAGEDENIHYDSEPQIVTVTVTDDGNGTMTASADPEDIVFNNYTIERQTVHASVELSKKNTEEQVIEGALFGIFDNESGEGTPLLTFTAGTAEINTESPELASVLPKAGASVDLYVVEMQSPEGYLRDPKPHILTISATEQGEVDVVGKKYVLSTIYTAEIDGNTNTSVTNEKTKVSISKVDVASSEELEGAHIQILDEDENIVEEWDSTTETHTIEGLKTNTEYTLRETNAPEGYKIASDTKFRIDDGNNITSDGTVTEDGIILIEDELLSVNISKVDITNGEEIEGAMIQVFDDENNIVDEWVSLKEIHTISGIIAN